MRVGTWPQKWLDTYNSIVTAYDEDEGRQITDERAADPSADPISALLFVSISVDTRKRGGENRGNEPCVRHVAHV